jgi:hypothetical protein
MPLLLMSSTENSHLYMCIFSFTRCVVAMLRQALNENLLTKQSVLKHIGSRFRVKLSLPEWKTDEEVGQFLLQ